MDAKKVETGSGDAISSLPDEILCKILALLPTKLAAATSLLSKRWRTLIPLMNHLFASQHHFCLDDSELLYPGEQDGKRRDIRESFKSLRDIRESFKSFVDKTLSNCKSMKKLSLKCRHDRLSLDLIDQWIQKAFEQGLVDLDLYLETTTVISQGSLVHFGQIVHLPSTFFINKSLVSFILGINFGTVATMFPKKVSLPVLKSLILNGVWSGIELLCHLMLPGCPILEELSLHYLDGYPLTRPRFGALSIVHTTLKRVTLDYNKMIDYSNLVFNTPSLVYLDYSGIAPSSHPTVNYCFLDSLVEAKLDVVHVGNNPSTKLSMIINWMRNVKTLSLTSASVKTMSSHLKEELPLFVNLVKLSFESDTEQGWEVLPRMLNKSPKLETLVLKGLHCVRKEGVCIDQKEVKVLEIHAFSGKGREFRQLKSFLCQMQFLQEMRVKIKADDYKTLQLISRLLDLPERSSKCEIHFL